MHDDYVALLLMLVSHCGRVSCVHCLLGCCGVLCYLYCRYKFFLIFCVFFFFKQKTAYEMPKDWSSDVCSSDLFFAEPRDVKRAIERSEDNSWGYYDRELTKNTLDWKEVFDFGAEPAGSFVPRWPAELDRKSVV